MPVKPHYVVGDATQPKWDGLKVIVHCCNDIGAWGAGFTKALSGRWSDPEEQYLQLPALTLGYVQFVPVEHDIVVANLIGQRGIRGHRMSDYSPPIRYQAIREGLERVADYCLRRDATVHMPRMGAGLAGGEWKVIEEIVTEVLVLHGVTTTVYDLPPRQPI